MTKQTMDMDGIAVTLDLESETLEVFGPVQFTRGIDWDRLYREAAAIKRETPQVAMFNCLANAAKRQHREWLAKEEEHAKALTQMVREAMAKEGGA